jgi:hypothetical protein
LALTALASSTILPASKPDPAGKVQTLPCLASTTLSGQEF